MLKLVLLLFVVTMGSALNCQECVNEMHGLSFLIANYCPGLTGHEEQCENDLTKNYVQMLFMVVQHFFVDGAQHICEAWNFCPVPQDNIVPEPHPYTCEECVEGLEVVGAYMTDPLWIAEYTLYLEQNFCSATLRDAFRPSRLTSPPCTPWWWRLSGSPRTSVTTLLLRVEPLSLPSNKTIYSFIVGKAFMENTQLKIKKV